MQTNVRNRLSEVRRSRGVGVAGLAKKAGVTRQTIYEIESGAYIPNTEVALRLSRELEVPVEDLFALREEEPEAPEPVQTDVLSATEAVKGQGVRVCQVGDRLVSIPVNAIPSYLPEADGVITKLGRTAGKAELMVFAREDDSPKQLVLAGCDPAIGLLSRYVERLSGVEIISAAASSKLALHWLQEDKVHIAGTHLEDPETGEFNLPFIRREFPDEDFAVITFARWEQGFVTAAGNPKKIKKVEDLTRKSVRFVNREPGSGSRALLDRLLGKAGIPAQSVRGYDGVAYGHLAAAFEVLAKETDCCLATRSAAKIFGLHFVPLQSERYDFAMRRKTMETPAAQSFLDALQRASFRRRLEVLAGYDTAQSGAILA